MDYLPKEGYKRVAVLFMYAVIAFLCVKYLLPLILPFIVAWLVGLILQPMVSRTARLLRVGRRVAAVMLLTLVLAVLCVSLWSVVSRVSGELVGVGEYVGDKLTDFGTRLGELTSELSEKYPLPDILGDGEGIVGVGRMVVSRLSGEVASALSSTLPKAFSALPSGLFFAVITIVACYYITADFERVSERLASKLPTTMRLRLTSLTEGLKTTGLRYLRACLYLMLVTFCGLFCGFLILGIDYAFTIALLCALADMLPVIGVPTILVPWGLILIIGGSTYRGVGILIICGLVTVLRQIVEPRILGSSLGLDPVATLLALYAGYKAGGVLGMIVAPLLAIVVCGGVRVRSE